MKVHGYCIKCTRIKRVSVTAASLSRSAARGSRVVTGICDSCQQAEDDKRRGR